MAENEVLDDRPLVSPQFTGRLLQVVFCALFFLATALLLVIAPEVITGALFAPAAVLIVVATVIPFLPVFARPRYRLWMLVMPALDFLAFLVLRSEGTGGVTNPMVMMLALPAVWVGLMKLRAALVLIVPIVYSVIIPDIVVLARQSLDDADADRAIMLIAVYPLTILFSAGAAFAMTTILTRRQVSLGAAQTLRADAARETDRLRRLMTAVVDTLSVGVIVLTPSGELLVMNKALRQSPELRAGGADPWDSFRTTTAYYEDRTTPIPVDDTTLSRLLRGDPAPERLVWAGPPGSPQTALSVAGIAVHGDDGEHLVDVIVINNVTDLVLAIEARDAFTGTVSHELRTPLTTVAGFLELLLDRVDQFDDEVAEWLRVMDRNVRRQQLLVRDLLTAAEARNTTLALDLATGDLRVIARDAADAVRKEAEARNITLHVLGPPVVGDFDASRMAQVAENLLTNAIRYSPDGSSIEVQVDTAEDRLMMRVIDHGPGIDPADQAFLFEHFFRTASARSSAIRGTGLGLPIVKAIVEAHGGELELTSEVGVGTTVTVTLPH